jgi:hypothetical protein
MASAADRIAVARVADRHELWLDSAVEWARDVSQSRGLQPQMASATVPRMPQPPAHRLRRFAGLAAVSTVLVVTLALTAFGPRSSAVPMETTAVVQFGASGLPMAQIVATHGPLRIQLPIAQARVTALGYHGAGDGALRLEPLGKRGNQGLLGRLRDKIFGSSGDGLVWYQLEGGGGPATSSLAVGAAPATDAFSPVDGIVVAIREVVVNRRPYGVRIDIQPASAPSLVVSVTRLRPDPALTVGSPVIAAKTRLGSVLDLAAVERMALARYTQDAGNHLSLEVRPAATLALP